MSRQNEDELWREQVMVDTVYELLEESPDYITDLGILAHIMYTARWYGKLRGWSDVPINFLAQKSRMGHRRIQASLDRLIVQGFVKADYNNQYAKKLRRPKRYRLMPKTGPWKGIEAKAYTNREDRMEEREVSVESERIKRTEALKRTPQSDGEEIMIPLVWEDFGVPTYIPRNWKIDKEAAHCDKCGRQFIQGMGGSPLNNITCAGCYVVDLALDTPKSFWEEKFTTIKKWTVEELDEFCRLWAENTQTHLSFPNIARGKSTWRGDDITEVGRKDKI